MKIKDYRDAQLHYTKDDRGDATGAFEMFVAEEPSSMVPEPRPMFADGQLVQPNDDGSRPGYNGRGGARPNTGGDRSEFIDYEARIKNPGKKKLDIAEKVHGNKPEYKGLKGFELWKKLKNFERSNIRKEIITVKLSLKPKKNK